MGEHPRDPEGRVIPDGSWPPTRRAPDRLERLRRFLNTVHRENGADHLSEPVRAARWLAGDGWSLVPDESDLVTLRGFRDELHSALRDRGGGRVPRWPAATTGAPLAVRSGDGGDLQLVGGGAGVDRVVGELLAVLVEAALMGTLRRLRVCANEHCAWTFYDHSKNVQGQWCTMAACGQRQKMRRYRARQRSARDRG
jgi:predicted RNA-binding Zn ribbon-like protein